MRYNDQPSHRNWVRRVRHLLTNPTARYDLDADYYSLGAAPIHTRQLDVLGYKSALPRLPERDHQRLIGVGSDPR
jgi:hypothetical protein